MKIRRLDVYHIRIPLISPWKTAYGVEDTVDSVLAKAYADNAEAWVETCPLSKPRSPITSPQTDEPLYSTESAESAYRNIIDLYGPIIIGEALENAERIPSLLNSFKGNCFAKAGIEQCWWALTAAQRKIPLRQLISGNDIRNEKGVQIRSAFGITDSIDILLKKIGHAVSTGIQDIKLKIKRGWDSDVLKEVTDAFPNLKITVDCNGGYSLDDLAFFKRIDTCCLEMIEQPLPQADLNNHAILRKELETPVCLDESIVYVADAEHAITLKSCQIINIKIGRVGGISHAVKIHDLCQKNGLDCLVGGMIESGIGTAFNIELAAAFNNKFAHGITLPADYHKIELTAPSLSCFKPGIIEFKNQSEMAVNENVISDITVSKQVIE